MNYIIAFVVLPIYLIFGGILAIATGFFKALIIMENVGKVWYETFISERRMV